ncbi:MmcQ/YjbR family DNA-binding protein [Vagococcus xieshaowenii]|uniref:MmcQ/YjbR family DNA-binding protein n=1 Tax=Vagococcus xieshaowenii TaxID=2562451 RepID=A0AAJ5EEQ4_9ENTE|nr:MmcQ/YjbR family DNA-binding protein [Vagococcus xieshaowenii]TFZ40662.1 MmcQ/YjbR family DNA-binding protein [Vagococcus xieshaowenii]
MQQRMDYLIRQVTHLPYAKVYLREDWNVYYFDIFGKMFGLMSPEATTTSSISLKNIPEQNEEWRELYPTIVTPGFHLNKKHWNTILLDQDEIADEVLGQLLTKSFELVCANLKKEQKEWISKRKHECTISINNEIS